MKSSRYEIQIISLNSGQPPVYGIIDLRNGQIIAKGRRRTAIAASLKEKASLTALRDSLEQEEDSRP